MGFLSWLPFIGKAFDTIGSITNKISDTKVALARVTSETERARLEAELGELQAKRDGLIASQKGPFGWITNVVQGLLGLAIVVLVWKLAVYDKALGQWTHGHTEALGKDLWDLIKIAFGFYFVTTWFRR